MYSKLENVEFLCTICSVLRVICIHRNLFFFVIQFNFNNITRVNSKDIEATSGQKKEAC